jgi:hypothetical protein
MTYIVTLLGLAVLAFGCKQLMKPAPVAIDSIEDLHNHPNAKILEFTGQTVQTILGFDEYLVGQYTSGKQVQSRTWVIPVVDPAASIGKEIHMWVSQGYDIPGQHDPSDWFRLLSEKFDGQPLQLKIISRLGERPKAGWEKAIHHAEQAHNVRSHPAAAVVFYPGSKNRPD